MKKFLTKQENSGKVIFIRKFHYMFCKPVRKKSRLKETYQRAAGGGMAVWELLLNGLSRLTRT